MRCHQSWRCRVSAFSCHSWMLWHRFVSSAFNFEFYHRVISSVHLLFFCFVLVRQPSWRRGSTSICLMSVPLLFQCLHFSSPDLLSRCQSTFSFASHTFNVAVECLVWDSVIFHPVHMTQQCKSSFLDFVNYCFLLLQCIPDSFISHFLSVCVQALSGPYLIGCICMCTCTASSIPSRMYMYVYRHWVVHTF